MSQRKRRKGKNQHYRGETRKTGETVPQTGKARRMNPAARNLLLADLVMLAIAQLCQVNGWMTQTAAAWVSLVGLIMIIAALWLQFGQGKRKGPRPPKGPLA